MSVQISVIIPVYNTVRYLEECVQSVLQQTYRDFEVVLADDGSTDGSVELCQALCARDSRVRLLRLEHGGVSAARNAAMEAARGEYLFFLDSDDGIHPRMLETLYALAEETGAELASTEFFKIEEQDTLPAAEEGGEMAYSSLDNQEALRCFCAREKKWDIFSCGAGKLVRRESVGDLIFDCTMPNGEDTKFMYQLMERVARGAILHREWYYYRRNSESITNRKTPELYQNRFECYRFIANTEYDRGRTDNARAMERYITDQLMELCRLSREERDRQIVDICKSFAREEMDTPSFRTLSLRRRARFWLDFTCYPLYECIHFFTHRWWLRKNRGESTHG